ncbi:hypothetical protein [Parasphingorhabdus sp.]|uniref:hypothetical protein n=1 Tax=Parasphingorhabdus sp. TaxID=2709688 RepID=UPI003003994D
MARRTLTGGIRNKKPAVREQQLCGSGGLATCGVADALVRAELEGHGDLDGAAPAARRVRMEGWQAAPQGSPKSAENCG